MPETLHAILLFAFFVVPGFLLRSGYLRTRAHGSVEADLYALAEAVVGSLFLLAIAWWIGGSDVVAWAEAHQLAEHRDAAYRLGLTLLLAPYPLGLAIGWLVNGGLELLERWRTARATPGSKVEGFFKVLDASALLEAPTVWDQTWNAVSPRRLYVRIGTKSGQEIVGAFDTGSWVGLSPEPRQVFLSKVYREKETGSHQWEEVPKTKGVFVDAAEVEFIEFAG